MLAFRHQFKANNRNRSPQLDTVFQMGYNSGMDLKKPARIVSEIFNGFVMMILTPSIAALVSDTALIYKILIPIVYLAITIIPFAILRKLGKVSDYEFTKREERPLYFTIVTVGYHLLFILFSLLTKEPTISLATLALFTTSCVLTMVTLYWKMSGHMTYSTLFFFTLLFLFPKVSFLPLIFIFTPLIATSRVILKKHTIWQTIIGTLVCATISILIYWVI